MIFLSPVLFAIFIPVFVGQLPKRSLSARLQISEMNNRRLRKTFLTIWCQNNDEFSAFIYIFKEMCYTQIINSGYGVQITKSCYQKQACTTLASQNNFNCPRDCSLCCEGNKCNTGFKDCKCNLGMKTTIIMNSGLNSLTVSCHCQCY